jgi:hypothetical protein
MASNWGSPVAPIFRSRLAQLSVVFRFPGRAKINDRMTDRTDSQPSEGCHPGYASLTPTTASAQAMQM